MFPTLLISKMENSGVFNIEQLIQAAEYLDRRERGNILIFSRFCVSPRHLEVFNFWQFRERSMWVSNGYVFISEAEHGYASTAPMPEFLSSKRKTKPKKSQGNRYFDILLSICWLLSFHVCTTKQSPFWNQLT